MEQRHTLTRLAGARPRLYRLDQRHGHMRYTSLATGSDVKSCGEKLSGESAKNLRSKSRQGCKNAGAVLQLRAAGRDRIRERNTGQMKLLTECRPPSDRTLAQIIRTHRRKLCAACSRRSTFRLHGYIFRIHRSGMTVALHRSLARARHRLCSQFIQWLPLVGLLTMQSNSHTLKCL